MTPAQNHTDPKATPTLEEAVDAVAALASSAGLDVAAARREALQLAAAVAESAPGAAGDWAAAAGVTASGASATQAFFDAASRGRRWRESPTATLSGLVAQGSSSAGDYAQALARVASAACGLGEPTMRVIGNASVAAAAQLGAVSRVRPGLVPEHIPLRPAVWPNPAVAAWETSVPGVEPPAPAGEPQADPAEPAEVEEAAEPTRSLEELLAELDGLIGLERVKREIHRQVAVLRVEKLRVDAGLKAPTMTRHLVFTGNPGTGKTTVARLVGGIYQALELLSKGHLVEVDRSELVAGYLGQTATKTAEVVASAAGGVLFIDEAYSLTSSGPSGDQYGREAVDTLVKEMDDLVVIVAGYPAPMKTFIGANPGLASRFRTTIEFEDYTDDELVAILLHVAEGADYEVLPEAVERFREVLARTPRGDGFGNGRFSRNALEAAIGHHAWRLRKVDNPTLEQLRQLVAKDFDTEPQDDAPVDDTSADDTPVDDKPADDAAPDSPENLAVEGAEPDLPASHEPTSSGGTP